MEHVKYVTLIQHNVKMTKYIKIFRLNIKENLRNVNKLFYPTFLFNNLHEEMKQIKLLCK